MNDQTYFALIKPFLPLEQHFLSGVAIWKYYKLETLILMYYLFEDLPMIKESTSILLNLMCMNPKLEWNLHISLEYAFPQKVGISKRLEISLCTSGFFDVL